MIVDTSAVFAILLAEVEGPRFRDAITRTPLPRISAGTWIEIGGVLVRRFRGSLDADFDALTLEMRLQIEPVTPRQAEIGREAYRRYGIGSGHEAALNFGDCFAYALAIDRGEPLLFKGDDFIHTDVRAAIRASASRRENPDTVVAPP